MVGLIPHASVSSEGRKTKRAPILLPSKRCAALSVCQTVVLLVQFLASSLLLSLQNYFLFFCLYLSLLSTFPILVRYTKTFHLLPWFYPSMRMV